MKTQSLTRCLGMVVALGLPFAPLAGAADLTAFQDTYVSSAAPSSNFGAAANLVIAPGNTALVQFDLSAVPPAATVAKAYLRVYVNKLTAGGTLNVSPVLSSWGELTVTEPAPSTGAPLASIPVSVGNSFLLVDVTAQAQAWLAAPVTNFGLALTGAGSTALQLDTKENTGTSHPAELELTITGPAGAAGPTGSAGISGSVGAIGPVGPQGAIGATGPQGAPGPIGPVGPAGSTGIAGSPGAQGLAGAQGPAGAPGLPGPAGAAGATGAQGVAGPAGPTGATGPIGFTGSLGPQGATGPQGPAGAAGLSGPTSNHFALDPTVRPSGYVIPDTDTYLYYLVNNGLGSAGACAPSAIINLPHSAVVGAGRMVIVSSANVPNTSSQQCLGVTVAVQGGDTLRSQTGGSTLSEAHPITLVSDGAGHWNVMVVSGR